MKSFLDDAEHGVILFSLGSLTAAEVSSSNVKAFVIQTFRRIQQRVKWKFNDKIDGLPNNVLLSEWLPQKEILGIYIIVIKHCMYLSKNLKKI